MHEPYAPVPELDLVAVASVPLETVWYDLKSRLPRPAQTVRVVTTRGVRSVARFEVAHTDQWPSGVSWLLERTGQALAFGDVTVWTPDLEALPGGPDDVPAMPVDVPAAPAVDPPALVGELVSEIVRTGEVLQRLPQPHLDWTPHPHLPSLRTLGLRVVRIAARVGWVLELDAIEQTYEPDVSDLQTVDQMVAAYLANQHAVRRVVGEATPARLREPWTLLRHGTTVVQLPRGNALRRFGLGPLVQHRAQLVMLLTALGVSAEPADSAWTFGETLAPQSWASGA